tara:strand:+ start:199 stop:831 length:633 start_codon:yes stop_codon:yes gene_type:complete
MKIDLFNISGKKEGGSIKVSKDVFGIEPNEHCVYLAVKSEMGSMRQGTHSSKTRAEVHGSGRKPWRQKGTGRSRIGSTRNPSRVHGGTAFGPEPRNYKDRINKKVKLLARKSVLSDKMSSKALIGIDEIKLESPKTKEMVNLLGSLNLSGQKVAVLLGEYDENIWLSFRNLRNVSIMEAKDASTYDLLDCENILIDKAGIEALNNALAKG